MVQAPAKGWTGELNGKNRHILFVEDEQAIRKILARKLTQVGFEVLQAGDAAHAMQHLLGQDTPEIDLIITDIIMPGMSGVELIKHARTEGIKAPVIYISGYDEMQIELIESGAVFFQKPFTIEALLAVVARAIT